MSLYLKVPRKHADRFDEILKEVWQLPDEVWNDFWDDIIPTMESRLAILKKMNNSPGVIL